MSSGLLTDYLDSLLFAVSTPEPPLSLILQICASRWGAEHFALISRCDVGPRFFTISSDVVNFCLTNGRAFDGLTVPTLRHCDGESFLWIPINGEIFLILVNPAVTPVPDDELSIAQSAVRTVVDLMPLDIDYALAVVDTFTDADLVSLGRRSFSVAAHHPRQVFLNAFAMFTRTGICERASVSSRELCKFMVLLQGHHNDVPYHNWQHALDALQYIFSLYTVAHFDRYLNHLEVFGLFLATLCHDTGHDGCNNNFHRNARTPFAHLAPNLPPLEHHHSCITHDLTRDLLSSLNDADMKFVSRFVIDCIMATDMEQHKAYLDKFAATAGVFDRDNPEHRLLLAQILLKCADVSNILRDFDEAKRMAECLTNECRRQGRLEKAKGLPISPMCNPDDTTPLCVGQVGFITFVAGPLMNLVHGFFPELEENRRTLEENLQRWTALKKAWEGSKR